MFSARADKTNGECIAMRFCISAIVFLLVAFAGPRIRAECIKTGRWWLEHPSAELVFSGTVDELVRTATLGFRASVVVDRVWKGSPGERFDLFVWELSPEWPRLEVGQRYVMALRRMHPTTSWPERDGAGVVGDSIAFTPISCGAEPYAEAERSGLLRDFGQGYAPK